MINYPISQGEVLLESTLTSVKDKAKDPFQALKLNITLSIVIVK